MFVIDASRDHDLVYADMTSCVRKLPRSRGPQIPPRAVLLAPRGVGVREHASRLAVRLGAVFIDGTQLMKTFGSPRWSSASRPSDLNVPAPRLSVVREMVRKRRSRMRSKSTTMEMKNAEACVLEDPLGAIGLRLRQPDCVKHGWVLCNYPGTSEQARLLSADPSLTPLRIVVLSASCETCVSRLRQRQTDCVTGTVWTTRPKSEIIRKRLRRDPMDLPAAVTQQHADYLTALSGILAKLGAGDKVATINADRVPEAVFLDVADFVERPLPLPERGEET